jgi:Ser-tRNA(Ala) deacylase AlaX
MVEKIFRENPYLDSCEATIAGVDGNEITLDKTVFFAFAGGQESDSGTIGGFSVLEARAQGKEIFYKLEGSPSLSVGDKVEVKIGMEKRMRIMRLHSAAHIAYFLFAEHTKIEKLIGSNVTSEKSRVDFEHDGSIAEKLLTTQKEMDELVSRKVPIKTYPDEKNPDRWWWECEGMRAPCGGTHVKSTGELGRVILKRKNIGSGKERIEITLG